MKHTLNISFEADEGALLRLLGLVQRRGFSVEGIAMPQTEDKRKTVALTVAPMSPNNRIDVLQRQIERLQEVRHVSLAPEKPMRLSTLLRHPVACLRQRTLTPEAQSEAMETPC